MVVICETASPPHSAVSLFLPVVMFLTQYHLQTWINSCRSTSLPPASSPTPIQMTGSSSVSVRVSVQSRKVGRRERLESLDANAQAPARSAPSTVSGLSRVTPSRTTSSSASFVPRHPDFNAPAIDLQLPPVSRSIRRAAAASRSSVALADSSASLGTGSSSFTHVASAGQVGAVFRCLQRGPWAN